MLAGKTAGRPLAGSGLVHDQGGGVMTRMPAAEGKGGGGDSSGSGPSGEASPRFVSEQDAATEQSGLVVLVHGQPGTAEDWDLVAGLLAEGRRVVRDDRPGWGSNSHHRPGGIFANAEALVGRLSDEDGPATVVGHSYGAAVAVAAAHLHPELVSRLVLVCPALTPESLGWLDLVLSLPLVGSALAFGSFTVAGRILGILDQHGERLPGLITDRLWPLAGTGVSSVFAAARRPWASFVAEQRALPGDLKDLEAILGDLEVPVTIVGGARDRVVRPVCLAELTETIPRSEIVWLEGGHLLPWTAPHALAKAIAAAVSGDG